MKHHEGRIKHDAYAQREKGLLNEARSIEIVEKHQLLFLGEKVNNGLRCTVDISAPTFHPIQGGENSTNAAIPTVF